MLLSALFALFPFLALVTPPARVSGVALSRPDPAPTSTPNETVPAPARTPAILAERSSPPLPVADSIRASEAMPQAEGALPTAVRGTRLKIVVEEAGRGVSGARIEVTHEPPQGESTVLLREADAGGALELALGPGNARIVAWSDASTALPTTVELEADTASEVTLTLEPGWTVAGRVVDDRTGVPVSNARLAFWTFAESDVVHTASDGTFLHPRFPRAAPAQQIEISAAGYGSTVRYLRLLDDGSWKLSAALAEESALRGVGTPWIELTLVPELRIRGRVLTTRGNPLPGARVAAEGYFHVLPSVASRDTAAVLTDESGHFELFGLRSDIGHSLVVEAEGHARRSFELEPLMGNDLDLGDIALGIEAVLSGAVVDVDGLPLVDVTVLLTLAAVPPREQGGLDVAVRLESRERRTRTGPEGTFVFEKLEPRVVRLALETADGLRDLGEFHPQTDGSFAAPCLVLQPAWMPEVAAKR